MRTAAVPFTEHLEELRNRIIKSLIAIGVGTLIAFFFNEWILDVLARPYQVVVPDGDLAFFRPTEAFSLVMRLSLLGGFILASPVILYQLWRFVAPAHHAREALDAAADLGLRRAIPDRWFGRLLGAFAGSWIPSRVWRRCADPGDRRRLLPQICDAVHPCLRLRLLIRVPRLHLCCSGRGCRDQPPASEGSTMGGSHHRGLRRRDHAVGRSPDADAPGRSDVRALRGCDSRRPLDPEEMTATLGDPARRFLEGEPFEPDRFQLDAIRAVERGASVVVAAPTGSGKTLIAEAAALEGPGPVILDEVHYLRDRLWQHGDAPIP